MGTAAVGRIVQKRDFERMLSVPARQRSAHFALHHLPERPAVRALPARLVRESGVFAPVECKLSTGDALGCTQPVDDLPGPRQWLGFVVPKRYAKRAVTRSLVKRQMQHQFRAACCGLPPGLWVLRLKAPLPREQFPSAHSEHLATSVRTELNALLQRAADAVRAAHGR